MVNKQDMAYPHTAYCYTYKLIFESANCYKGAEIQVSEGLDFRKYKEGKNSLRRKSNTKVGRKCPVERKEIRKVLRGPTPWCVWGEKKHTRVAEAKVRVIRCKVNDKKRSGLHTIPFLIVRSIDSILRGQENQMCLILPHGKPVTQIIIEKFRKY